MPSTKRKAPETETRSVSSRTCATNNHCFARDILHLDAPKKRKGVDDDCLTQVVRKSPRKETRLLPRDKKVAIFKEMFRWKTEGGDSPVGRLVKEFGVHRNTPKKILDKVVHKGSVDNQWNLLGRPAEFGEEVWEDMVDIIRTYREAQQMAPARIVRSDLLQRFNETAPSTRHIQRKKATMGYHVVKVVMKPTLDKTKDFPVRLAYASRWTKAGASWARVVHIDEKWFTEEKPKKPKVEARRGSPLKNKFTSHKKETQTQLNKLMYLAAVCKKGAVGIWLLDWSKYFKQNKDGSFRRGKVDSEFMKPFWKKIYVAAVKVLGPGPITIVIDRASCHVSKVSKAEIQKWFADIQIQPPRSPDFNLLDASVFPTLEKECNKSGAVSHEQIKKAVASIWNLVTPTSMGKAVRKVKRNMEKSVELKGGNYFYD